MRFSKRSSVFVFGLLVGGLCSPGAKASADETPLESLTLETQAPDAGVPVVYLTAVSTDSEDAGLPDDPGAGTPQQNQQQQIQVASGAPPER